MPRLQNLALLPVVVAFACGAPKEDDTASGEETGRTPETPFDESCAGQVMYTQAVCASCTEVTVDWSGLTADSAGAPIDPGGDIAVVHWYILGMPVSTLNTRLCGDEGLEGDVLGANAQGTSGATEATLEIGTWDYGTGVIALYDTIDELSEADPRAAAIFELDAESTNTHLVIEGRGDVWTAP